MLRRAGRGSINPVLIEKTVPQSLWRNGIARWTSNPEAPGSSPGRDESLCVPHGRPAIFFLSNCAGDILIADDHAINSEP